MKINVDTDLRFVSRFEKLRGRVTWASYLKDALSRRAASRGRGVRLGHTGCSKSSRKSLGGNVLSLVEKQKSRHHPAWRLPSSPVEAAGPVDAKSMRPQVLGKLQNVFHELPQALSLLVGRAGIFQRVKNADIQRS